MSLWQSYVGLRLSPEALPSCIVHDDSQSVPDSSRSSLFTSPSIIIVVVVFNGFVTFLSADVQHYLSSVDDLLPILEIPLPLTPATFTELVRSIQD